MIADNDDNVEDNMDDILNSIRQIMDMNHKEDVQERPAAPTRKVFPEIPHVITDKKVFTAAPSPKEDKETLVLSRKKTSSKPAESKADNSAPTDRSVPKDLDLGLPPIIAAAIKPALQEWMNEHLQSIVEQVVREEVQRLFKSSK